MLLPLGTDRPLRRPTLVNHALIGANVVIYLVQVILESSRGEQVWEALSPFILNPNNLNPWSFITYQFLHGDFLHLLFNMLFLWVFGPPVEDRFTRFGYLTFYLAGGAAAGGLHALFSEHPVLGASGSIAAVTGAFLVLFPRTHVRILLFFFLIGVYEIPAVWFIGFAVARDLVFQSLGAQDNVARLAHIGGYVFGAIIPLILLALKIIPREPYDLFSLSRQARRRRAFKEITSRGTDPWRARRGRATGPWRDLKSPEPEPDAAATAARAEISRLHASGAEAEAADAYRRALQQHANLLLQRRLQLDLANHFHQTGDHKTAARAYTLFLDRHPRDAEAPRVRLLLGLLCARYLNDHDRARTLLQQAVETLRNSDEKTLARTLLAEISP